jgi:hypothetical protein
MADQSIIIDKPGLVTVIDGTKTHYSDPFFGKRVSVVAFQHSSASQLSKEDKIRLAKLGFKSHMLSDSGPMSSAGLPGATQSSQVDCAMSLAAVVCAAATRKSRTDDPSDEGRRLKTPNRIMIELCTGHDSRLGRAASWSKGCYCIRITVDDDLTSWDGVVKAVAVLQQYPAVPALIWVSIPCTGGSPWQRINRSKGEHVKQSVQQHIRIYRQLMQSAAIVLSAAKSSHGCFKIAWEWPRQCDYWRDGQYLAFREHHNLKSALFDGCMYGLVSRSGSSSGTPILKPWRVDSDCEELLARLNRRCDGTHQHAPCAGRDTKASEGYTDSISREVHRAWQQHCANLSIGAVAVAARVVPLAACTVSRHTLSPLSAHPIGAMASSGFSAADLAAAAAAAAASHPAEGPSAAPGS